MLHSKKSLNQAKKLVRILSRNKTKLNIKIKVNN